MSVAHMHTLATSTTRGGALLALVALLPASVLSAPVWSRGGFSRLQASSNGSLTLTVGDSFAFLSPAPLLAPTSFATGSSALGPWGGYDFIAYASPSATMYEVRYHAGIDAFTFHYDVRASPFPFFGAVDNVTAAAGLISYSESYMLPGERSSLASCAPPHAPVPPQAIPTPGDCPNLTGEWCCDWVSVRQVGSAVTTTAAWGNGSGTVSGHSINVTFSNVGAQTGFVTPDCNTIKWSPAGSTWTRAGTPSRATDGPMFIFPTLASPGAGSIAFSPLDNFTVSSAGCGALPQGAGFAPGFGAMYRPAGTPPAAPLSLILVGRPGVKRASVAWGAAMRRAYSTTRRRGVGSRALSYWSDNAAGYSFWSYPSQLDIWGQPEAIFSALHKGYAALKIPVVQWEVDSNMIPGAPTPWAGGWCWNRWGEFNYSLYPSGGNFSANAVGGAPVAFYVSSFCQDNAHAADGFRFVNVSSVGGIGPASVSHPDDAYKFYTSILTPAAEEWNMQHFFTDFLCFRGPSLDAELASQGSTLYAPSAQWLQGMTLAASDLGMEVQYCMACAHQALQSLQWPAVTNARVNGDGGLALGGLVFSTVMAASVGLGWSKDNLRLAVFPAGVTEIQTALAALSLGPVGLSDELEGYPTPLAPGASPAVVTNITLAMSTCTANGTLLQPSFPLTPVEDLLTGLEGTLDVKSGHVWATFTTAPGGLGPWFTALSFSYGAAQPAYTLLPRHLAPLLEQVGTAVCVPPSNPPDFASIPVGSFLGGGGDFPCGSWVAWDRGDPRVAAHFSATAPVMLPLDPLSPSQWNVAPIVDGLAFLGEKGKVVAVSSYRFASVVSAGGSAVVELRGAPAETVTVLWATEPTLMIQRKAVVLENDGTASVTIP